MNKLSFITLSLLAISASTVSGAGKKPVDTHRLRRLNTLAPAVPIGFPIGAPIAIPTAGTVKKNSKRRLVKYDAQYEG